jgi:hypothetical protein
MLFKIDNKTQRKFGDSLVSLELQYQQRSNMKSGGKGSGKGRGETGEETQTEAKMHFVKNAVREGEGEELRGKEV